MSTPWLLTTPASRGIGLALASHLLSTTRAPVVATARSDLPSAKDRILSSISSEKRDEAASRLDVLELDVLNEDSISAAASTCRQKFPTSSHHLHLGLIVPGVLYPEKSPSQIDAENALHALKVNLWGPMLLTKHFLPFLPKKATEMSSGADSNSLEGLPSTSTLAFMSARVGSVSDNRMGGWYSYRTSKAGVTQLAKSVDNFLNMQTGDKARAVALHPGTVKTDLSRGFWDSEGDKANLGRGLFSSEVAARQLIEVLRGLNNEQRGKFWDWRGEEVLP